LLFVVEARPLQNIREMARRKGVMMAYKTTPKDKASPIDIEITLRHLNGDGEAVKQYVLNKLNGVVRTLPAVKRASVEVTFEASRPRHQQFVVQATVAAGFALLRAEETGPDPRTTIDSVRDVLERRIRDWKGRVYFQRRRETAALKEASFAKVARIEDEPLIGEIVRTKSHESKPMFPEDAGEQMELLGHDFFLFLNAESGQHNVVYRRKAGGYGVIEPAA
jgi:putative sigma-54 modulation protein